MVDWRFILVGIAHMTRRISGLFRGCTRWVLVERKIVEGKFGREGCLFWGLVRRAGCWKLVEFRF